MKYAETLEMSVPLGLLQNVGCRQPRIRLVSAQSIDNCTPSMGSPSALTDESANESCALSQIYASASARNPFLQIGELCSLSIPN